MNIGIGLLGVRPSYCPACPGSGKPNASTRRKKELKNGRIDGFCVGVDDDYLINILCGI